MEEGNYSVGHSQGDPLSRDSMHAHLWSTMETIEEESRPIAIRKDRKVNVSQDLLIICNQIEYKPVDKLCLTQEMLGGRSLATTHHNSGELKEDVLMDQPDIQCAAPLKGETKQRSFKHLKIMNSKRRPYFQEPSSIVFNSTQQLVDGSMNINAPDKPPSNSQAIVHGLANMHVKMKLHERFPL